MNYKSCFINVYATISFFVNFQYKQALEIEIEKIYCDVRGNSKRSSCAYWCLCRLMALSTRGTPLEPWKGDLESKPVHISFFLKYRKLSILPFEQPFKIPLKEQRKKEWENLTPPFYVIWCRLTSSFEWVISTNRPPVPHSRVFPELN